MYQQLTGGYGGLSDEDAYATISRILPPDENGNRYSTDQIWAWVNGASTDEIEGRLDRAGGDFVQTVQTPTGEYYSFRMELPGNNNILWLLTTQEGFNRRQEVVNEIMRRRYGYMGDVDLLEIRPLNPFSGKSKELIRMSPDYLENPEYDVDEYENYDDFEDFEDFEE